jgi:hypothetical protein
VICFRPRNRPSPIYKGFSAERFQASPSIGTAEESEGFYCQRQIAVRNHRNHYLSIRSFLKEKVLKTGWSEPVPAFSLVLEFCQPSKRPAKTNGAPSFISIEVGSRTGNLLALARRALVASQRCPGSSFKIECSRLTARGLHRS